MKDDEVRLMLAMLVPRPDGRAPLARRVVSDIGMADRRSAYLFTKWARRGWYEWGVSPMTGWVTPSGRPAMIAALADADPHGFDVGGWVKAVTSPTLRAASAWTQARNAIADCDVPRFAQALLDATAASKDVLRIVGAAMEDESAVEEEDGA